MKPQSYPWVHGLRPDEADPDFAEVSRVIADIDRAIERVVAIETSHAPYKSPETSFVGLQIVSVADLRAIRDAANAARSRLQSWAEGQPRNEKT